MYQHSVKLNPFVAEPRIAWCQLLYHRGAYNEAAEQSAKALELLYQWGTCWDKR